MKRTLFIFIAWLLFGVCLIFLVFLLRRIIVRERTLPLHVALLCLIICLFSLFSLLSKFTKIEGAIIFIITLDRLGLHWDYCLFRCLILRDFLIFGI